MPPIVAAAVSLLLLLLIGGGCRTAQPAPPKSPSAESAAAPPEGEIVRGGFAAGAAGDFRANLFLVDDPETFIAAVRAPGDAVELPVAQRAKRGQEIVAFVAVEGCAGGDDGLCDVLVDFELRDSSGALKARQTDVALWRDPPEPVSGTMLFGEAALTLTIAADAPVGSWQLTARVTDRAASESVTLRAPLLVE